MSGAPHSPAGHAPRASGRSAAAWFTLLLTIILGVAADLGSKEWAFRTIADAPVVVRREAVIAAGPGRLQTLIPPHSPVTAIPHLLDFQLVLNAGAVFGAGQGKRWLFIGFTMLALAFALTLFARWTDRRDRIAHISIGLILAGGIGNLYDRAVFACVRDFLHPVPTLELPFGLAWPSGETLAWPWVSNVADALLLIGIGALVIRLWRHSPHESFEPNAKHAPGSES